MRDVRERDLLLVDDLDVSVTERLDALLRAAMPRRHRRRFSAAAARVADVLEKTTPILGVDTPRGLLLGIYAEVTPGRLSVAVASADDAILFAPELRALDEARADAELVLARRGVGWGEAGGALPRAIAEVLETQALSTARLGLLLAAGAHRELIRRYAQSGVTPALVALLSTDRNGSARLVLPHGRTWPAVEIEPEAGRA